MNCQVCGAEVVPGAQFCGSCGAPVAAPTAQTPMPPPAGAAGAPPGAFPPYPAAAPAGEPPSGSSKKGLLWGIVAAVVVALLGVGAFLVLGGDDDDETASGTTTTAAPATTTTTEAVELLALDDWADEADAICTDANEEFETLEEPETDEEIIEALTDTLDFGEEVLADLTALGMPDENEDEAEELLALFADRLAVLEGILADAEDGDFDPWEAFLDEGYDDADEAADLADELGLEVCATGGSDEPVPTTDDPTPPTSGGGDEPFTYGDDPALDALWDACADGDPDACDDLWLESPVDSEYEEFGYSCGGVVPEGEAQSCTDVLSGGGSGDEPASYGDDPVLDALWDACDGGDPDACDELWTSSEFGTEYYEFGFSCGGRVPEDEVEVCSNVM